MLGCCIKIRAAESNDTQEAEHAWSIDHQLVRLYGKVMGGTVGEGCGQTGQFSPARRASATGAVKTSGIHGIGTSFRAGLRVAHDFDSLLYLPKCLEGAF